MKRIFLYPIMIVLIMICLGLNSYSQNIEKKTYQTLFTKSAPEIDGLENDSCWSAVPWGNDFIQMQPSENKPPTRKRNLRYSTTIITCMYLFVLWIPNLKR